MRFQLSLPVAVTAVTRAGSEYVDLAGLTNNISSSGVLFTANFQPDLGTAIEYTIKLNNAAPQPVNLRCIGKVIRSERMQYGYTEDHALYQIAATLVRYEFVRPKKDIDSSH